LDLQTSDSTPPVYVSLKSSDQSKLVMNSLNENWNELAGGELIEVYKAMSDLTDEIIDDFMPFQHKV